MKAPKWLREALEAEIDGRRGQGEPDPDVLAAELLERLPIERIAESAVRALAAGVGDGRVVIAVGGQVACAVLAELVSVIGDDADAVTFTEMYRNACRALDAAGAPYAVDGHLVDLVGRIEWLASERPTRIELQQHVRAAFLAGADHMRNHTTAADPVSTIIVTPLQHEVDAAADAYVGKAGAP